MKFSKSSLVLLLLTFSGISDAQELKVIRDFRLFAELRAEKTLFNNWKIALGPTLKLEKDASRIDEFDLDLDVIYELNKIIGIGTGYRFTWHHKSDGTYIPKHRLYCELLFNQKISRFKLDYRVRFQNVDDDYFQAEQFMETRNILRNRLQLKYDFPGIKLSPYIGTELYGIFSQDKEFAFKMKYTLGVKYYFEKWGQIKILYRIDRELNDPDPYTYFHIGIGYSYDF